MAGLRASAALICGGVLLVGASYVRRSDVFSAGPLSESHAPSRISCAAVCDRQTECVGFTLTADDSCQLFDHVVDNQTASTGAVQVSYIRQSIQPCLSGWYLYRDSCYLRQIASPQKDWEECRSACQSHGSQSVLATLNDEQEGAWMFHHPSRPSTNEYIGLKFENGAFINIDGTSPSFQPPLEATAVPGCVNLGFQHITDAWYSWACTRDMAGYICESPLRCLSGSPCPAGWLALDDYCYHYVSTAKTWEGADQHCAALQTGARLAPIINMNIWRILYQHFGSGSDIYVGISDIASEGSFQSVDNSGWAVAWRNGEPSNGGGNEDCAVLRGYDANDVPCQNAYPFICRASREIC